MEEQWEMVTAAIGGKAGTVAIFALARTHGTRRHYRN